MFGFFDELANHGLDDADVAVEETTYGSTEQSNPNVGGESYHDHAKHGAHATNHEDRLAADAIGQASPVHAHEGLGEREGRDENTGVERGIFSVSEVKLFDECPGVREDGSESNRLSKANGGCGGKKVLARTTMVEHQARR
jgi:hypothetical protein